MHGNTEGTLLAQRKHTIVWVKCDQIYQIEQYERQLKGINGEP